MFLVSYLFTVESKWSILIMIVSIVSISLLAKNILIEIAWPIMIFYSIWVYNGESAFKYLIPILIFIFLLLFNNIKKIKKNDYVLLALVFWSLISLCFNLVNSADDEIHSILFKSLINFILILFFFIISKQQKINLNNFFKFFILFTFSLFFLSFLKDQTDLAEEAINRLSGLADVNTFCKFSSLALYFNLEKNFFKPFIRMIISISLVFATILTFSKMGFILLLIVLLSQKINLFKIKFVIPIIISLVIGYLSLKNIESRDIDFLSFLENRILPERSDSRIINRLSSDRAYIWENSLLYWGQYPSTFIFGQGLGTISLRNNLVFGHNKSIHNTLIELFLELGLVGVILYIIFLKALLKKSTLTLKLLVLIPLFFLSGPFRYDMFLVFVIINFMKDDFYKVKINQQINKFGA